MEAPAKDDKVEEEEEEEELVPSPDTLTLELSPVDSVRPLQLVRSSVSEELEAAGKVAFRQSTVEDDGELTVPWLFAVTGTHMSETTTADNSALACMVHYKQGNDQTFAQIREASELAPEGRGHISTVCNIFLL